MSDLDDDEDRRPLFNRSQQKETISISDQIRQWLLAVVAVGGVLGAMAVWQITANQTTAVTAEHVQQIQIDIKEIRSSLDGVPQLVKALQEQLRDEQNSTSVQNAQINALATITAETKIRVDNLERASNTKLR